jgi:hypothetical protein
MLTGTVSTICRAVFILDNMITRNWLHLTLHKKEKYLFELSRETLQTDPRKDSFDYLSTAIINMALNSHTLYIYVTAVVNLKTKNACANLHHCTHLFHFIQLLYQPSTCKGPLLC